ncbi:hypothetical protein DS2_13919 [Catenovulum agarivorans DS-2]|uniref:PEP-CTERM protein-sorting domain-containing protein n=1 Tax=Catenovulum agarivorans DS-2 TaxID=1328313 RepID=W7QV62_9ALTE|nr:PEP-CTERM sorting domain-containing protein [Catenovulum agarivorans]EWH09175.1 hypothetical protein DS2_13919 [Catenovulum agarivorans DS-2]
MKSLRWTLFLLILPVYAQAAIITLTDTKNLSPVYIDGEHNYYTHTFDLKKALGSDFSSKYSFNSLTLSWTISDDANDSEEYEFISDDSYSDVSGWTIEEKKRCNGIFGCHRYWTSWNRTITDVTDKTYESIEKDRLSIRVGGYTHYTQTQSTITNDYVVEGTETTEHLGVQRIGGQCIRPNGTRYYCNKTEDVYETTYTEVVDRYIDYGVATTDSFTWDAFDLENYYSSLWENGRFFVAGGTGYRWNYNSAEDGYISNVALSLDITELAQARPVPEPSTFALLISAFVGILLHRKRRRSIV